MKRYSGCTPCSILNRSLLFRMDPSSRAEFWPWFACCQARLPQQRCDVTIGETMRGLLALVVISWALIGGIAYFLMIGEIIFAAILFILLTLPFMTASVYLTLMPAQERRDQPGGRPRRGSP
jgi:hypothetical protein